MLVETLMLPSVCPDSSRGGQAGDSPLKKFVESVTEQRWNVHRYVSVFFRALFYLAVNVLLARKGPLCRFVVHRKVARDRKLHVVFDWLATF